MKTETECENLTGTEEKNTGKNKRFFIISIVISALAVLYFAYHIVYFGFNGYNSVIKNEFSVYETSVIENELGVVVPEDSQIRSAKYIPGKSPVLMVWITGIKDYSVFLTECTGFSSNDYKDVNIQISQNESSAAKYYKVLKDGDSDPTECYIYKLPDDENWTAYIIENDVTYDEVKSMF